jgi:SHS2 domain-containing protein
MTAAPPSHSFEDNTAEVALRLSAPTLESLFAEAGRALAELTFGEGPLPPPTGAPVRVTLDSVDRDALLVDWLNELVYRTETMGQLFVAFELERLEGASLVASIRGAEVESLRPLVKAATLHGVHITEQSHGYEATVVLDI